MLKKQVADEIKALIMQRKVELNQLLEDCDSIPDNNRTQRGDVSAGLDAQIYSRVDSKRALNELRRLEQNVSRLDGDAAGLCQKCGETIPVARLKAVLDARLCVECASAE